MPSTFFIPNHSAHNLTEIDVPHLLAREARPNFTTKAQMLEWAGDQSTEHTFYNFTEPKNSALRVSNKDNPAVWLHGLVADLDLAISDEMLAGLVAKMSVDFPVAFTSKTFSGGARMVWVFEKPVAIINGDLAKALLKRLEKEMKLSKLPCFDVGAFYDLSRYFELGQDWVVVNSNARISQTTLNKFLWDAAEKLDWRKEGGAEIPIDDIAAEVERRWPNRWAGVFAVGAMGVRFWDAKADSPKGAWVRENGILAFTGENKFMHWDEILGKAFVATYEANRIGGAITNSYFDGKMYWAKDAVGNWHANTTEVLRRDLRSKGLSTDSRKGTMPEVDRALHHIESNARIDGASAFVFNDAEIVSLGGQKLLNVSRAKAHPPADGVHAWGEKFPWIAKYLETVFLDGQLDVFLSWHHLFWTRSWTYKPTKGHAMFIAGPAGVGKTMLSYRILGGSVGGFTDASQYLLGATEFNSEILESPLGCVDDAVAMADRRSHDVYSQMVKKMVANPTLTYRKMYCNPVVIPYHGRIVITLNDDAVSIGMLPSVDGSILDKMIFLKASVPTVDFAVAGGPDTVIRAELPFYLSYLRDYKIPDHLAGASRFGMQAYKHPELLNDAANNSSSTEFGELVNLWRAEYFTQCKDADWKGTSSELLIDIQATESIKELARTTVKSTVMLGRMLSQLAIMPDSGVTVEKKLTNRGRLFNINRL
jgi:hypothetical protein